MRQHSLCLVSDPAFSLKPTLPTSRTKLLEVIERLLSDPGQQKSADILMHGDVLLRKFKVSPGTWRMFVSFSLFAVSFF